MFSIELWLFKISIDTLPKFADKTGEDHDSLSKFVDKTGDDHDLP